MGPGARRRRLDSLQKAGRVCGDAETRRRRALGAICPARAVLSLGCVLLEILASEYFRASAASVRPGAARPRRSNPPDSAPRYGRLADGERRRAAFRFCPGLLVLNNVPGPLATSRLTEGPRGRRGGRVSREALGAIPKAGDSGTRRGWAVPAPATPCRDRIPARIRWTSQGRRRRRLVFLAMAHAQLGHQDEEPEWTTRRSSWIEAHRTQQRRDWGRSSAT